MIDLRCGDWRDVLADVDDVDCVITDPPFSATTDQGFRGGSSLDRSGISYGSIDEGDIAEICDVWRPGRVRYFKVVFCDDVLAPLWKLHMRRVGYYVFAPLPWCKNDAPPRFLGDGPSSGTEWIVVGRRRCNLPRERRRSRPPHYKTNISREAKAGTAHGFVGGKPPHLMSALVRDYTEPGDFVCDPFSGSGSTAIAAEGLGRSFVGAELDPKTHAIALSRIARGVQVEMAL